MKVDCYTCDECFETFETHASMSKTGKYAKGHRVRCPRCGSENIRHAPSDGAERRSGQDVQHPSAPPTRSMSGQKGRQPS